MLLWTWGCSKLPEISTSPLSLQKYVYFTDPNILLLGSWVCPKRPSSFGIIPSAPSSVIVFINILHQALSSQLGCGVAEGLKCIHLCRPPPPVPRATRASAVDHVTRVCSGFWVLRSRWGESWLPGVHCTLPKSLDSWFGILRATVARVQITGDTCMVSGPSSYRNQTDSRIWGSF